MLTNAKFTASKQLIRQICQNNFVALAKFVQKVDGKRRKRDKSGDEGRRFGTRKKRTSSANVGDSLGLVSIISVVSSQREGSEATQSISSTAVEDNIAHLMIMARLALEQGDTDRAETMLRLGIEICERHRDHLRYALPQIYDVLATIALAEGDTAKAERVTVAIVEKLAQDGASDDDHHLVDFKLRLARIYSNKSFSGLVGCDSNYGGDNVGCRESEENRVLAEIGFRTCLAAQQAKLEKGDTSKRTALLYVNVLFWYAVHAMRNERYAEARSRLETARSYSQKIKSLSPYQEMVLLYTLADLNLELGETQRALDEMEGAIVLGKSISSVDLPRCYAKLAKILLTLGEYQSAKGAAEQSVKMARLFNKYETMDEAETILEEIVKFLK